MSAENNVRPQFNQYAGKIVNIAEVKAIAAVERNKPWRRLKSALKRPYNFLKGLANSFHEQPLLDSMQFYVTQAEKDAAPANPETEPLYASPANSYFEASNVLNTIYMLAGPSALPEHFLKAVATAPDHASELASGKLEKGGFAISIHLDDPGPSVSAVLLTPATPKYQALVTIKVG